jgi:uncharacterized membrane protein YphA (DoxX/SURF4 family)
MQCFLEDSVRTPWVFIAGVDISTIVAHVSYVTEDGGATSETAALWQVLLDPVTLGALIGITILAVGLAVVWERYRPFATDVEAFRSTMTPYDSFVPWLLRLSIGLPLVGAGFAGYLFAPVVQPEWGGAIRLFGVTLGFLILFGLATRLVAALGLAAYLGTVAVWPEALLAAEYVPAFIACVLVGPGRPSADHVLGEIAADDTTLYSRIDPVYRRLAVPFERYVAPYERFVPTVLRGGLGVAFIYLGVTQKLLAPGPALAVVAKYDLTAVLPVAPELWVVGAGLVEAAVGLALLAGIYTRFVALVAFLLFTTTLFGLPDDPALAHLSLFGLVSVLIITGSGPLALRFTDAEGA